MEEKVNNIQEVDVVEHLDIAKKNFELNFNFEHKLAIVFRLSALGDLVLLSGVLRFWYETFGVRFILISRSAFIPLFRYHPAIFEVYPLDEKDLDKYPYQEKCLDIASRYEDYPLIDLHNSLRSKALTKVWKNKVYKYNKHPVLRRLFLLSGGLIGSKKLLEKNVCQRYAEVLCPVHISREELKPQIYLVPTELDQAQKRLGKLFWKELSENYWSDLKPELLELWKKKQETNKTLRKKIIAIHPFATYSEKTLKKEKWLVLAKSIEERFSLSHELLWLGKGFDFTENTKIGKSLINKTNLRELCATLAHCDILITGDSGPMHIAGGVGCKVLALLGPSSEEWGFFPVGENTRTLQAKMSCRPCSLHGSKCSKNNKCFDELSNEQIIENLSEMLGFSCPLP